MPPHPTQCNTTLSSVTLSSSDAPPVPPIPWLLSMTGIAEGQSTILGGNQIAFYGIHSIGILIILTSLCSCSSVIYTVIRNNSRGSTYDFSDRFPLYVAVCDVLWGVSNLSSDHWILVIYQIYPSKFKASLLATGIFFFFGYQQLMNAGLSLYTYLKVVRRVSLGLGAYEWKLHVSIGILLVIQVAFFWYLDAFGNGGFWFLMDLRTKSGLILGGIVCLTASTHAALTLFAYRAIQNVISCQQRVFSYLESPLPPERILRPAIIPGNHASHPIRINSYVQQQSYSTATNCLTTFIYISLCLYIPLALACWVGWIFSCYGYIEPLSALGVTIFANSGGWVNALGYHHNRRLKEKRRARVQDARAKNSNSFLLHSR